MTLKEQRVINDCYILQSRIGEDSFTEHWLATVIFNATVFLLRFVKENAAADDALASLRQSALKGYHIHDAGLADIVEIETWEGRVFLSSEWQSLSPVLSFLDKGIHFSIETVCRHGIKLAFALKAFHENGLVFGGLNCQNAYGDPENSDFPDWKILKPGLGALLVKDLIDAPDLRDAWACLAPEYKRGLPTGPSSDIYSLGIILVRLLSARVPFPDSLELVQNESVPLRYIAGSLTRREVPEPLIRVVLGMLMHEASARYASCEDVIRDLKRVLAGKDEGFPGDSDRTVPKAVTPVRSFDTSDYFSSLSGENKKSLTKEGLSYPLTLPSESAEKPELIESEMKVLPEESSWTVNDYIDYGLSTVPDAPRRKIVPPAQPESTSPESAKAHDPAPEPQIPNQPRVEPPLVEPLLEKQPVSAPPKTTAEALIAESAAEQASLAEELQPSKIEQAAPLPVALQINKLRRRKRNPEAEAIRDALVTQTVNEVRPVVAQVVSVQGPDTGSEQWSCHRILSDDLSALFRHSLAYARKGKGSFRYIQEPVSLYKDQSLQNSFIPPASPFLFLDAGNFARFGTASPDDFLVMLRNAAGPLFDPLTPAARRSARKRLGSSGLQVFYGTGSPENPKRAIIDSFLSLAAKSRPLLIVLRGGERIDRDLHELLLELAKELHDFPVAVTVFFEHHAFPVWHSLNLLKKGDCPD